MKPTPINPPTDDLPRVLRGGAWGDYDAARVRAAARVTVAPAHWSRSLGFRCAQRGCIQPLKGLNPP